MEYPSSNLGRMAKGLTYISVLVLHLSEVLNNIKVSQQEYKCELDRFYLIYDICVALGSIMLKLIKENYLNKKGDPRPTPPQAAVAMHHHTCFVESW